MTNSVAIWSWIRSNVHTLDAVGGIKPFPEYGFVRKLTEALTDNLVLIVAKSRQMMATWTVSAYILYRALYDDPGIYLLLSKGKRDSGELVKRFRIMVDNMKGGEDIKVKNEEICFPSGSRIIALPATESATRMHSPTCVFWDEMAFTPYSEEIWTALKPAVDSGGCFVGVSTPNGTDNIFYDLYND